MYGAHIPHFDKMWLGIRLLGMFQTEGIRDNAQQTSRKPHLTAPLLHIFPPPPHLPLLPHLHTPLHGSFYLPILPPHTSPLSRPRDRTERSGVSVKLVKGEGLPADLAGGEHWSMHCTGPIMRRIHSIW